MAIDSPYAPYLEALASIESGGNYRSVGPKTKTGDRAYGRYQVMGNNVPEWTKIALGQSMSPQEFLSNNDAQDKVAAHYFGSAMQQYGNPQDAASVWFTGRPLSQGANANDGYITGSEYVNRFNKALQGQGVDTNYVSSAFDNGDGDQLPAAAKPTMQENKGVFADIADKFKADPMGSIGGALSGLGAGLVTAANPYAGAQLQAQFEARMTPKWGVIGKDHWGQDIYGWIDPFRRTVSQANGVAGSSGSGEANQDDFLVKLQNAGQDVPSRLAAVPQDMRPYVQALIEGRQLPQNMARGPQRDRLQAIAFAVDPSLDQNSLLQRQAFMKNLGNGSPQSYGGQITSANKLVAHLDSAYQQIPELTGGFFSTKDSDTLPWLNPLKEGFRNQSGDQAYKDASRRWGVAIQGISDELEKMLSGSRGAEASKRAWMQQLDIAKSGPTGAAAALDEIRQLMVGQLEGVAHAKSMAWGNAPVDPSEFLKPEVQDAMKRISGGAQTYQKDTGTSPAAAAQAAPQGATATKVLNGKTYYLINGQWHE